MLVFLWMCVATTAFVPNGDRVVKYYTAAIEHYYDNVLGEAPQSPAVQKKRAARAAIAA
jgi:hypothetical protein